MQINSIHIFIWLILMYFVSLSPATKRMELVNGVWVRRYRPYFAFLVFFPVIWMVAFGKLRGDLSVYISNYNRLPSTVSEGWYLLKGFDRAGFILLQLLIRQFSGGSVTAFRLVVTLIHAVPVILVFRKYSENYLFSCYLFIAAGCHLSWMMNGIRQFIAVTIIFAATPWIVEKKYFRVILIILLAATFHKTALFMIPVIFIVQGKVWNWKTMLFSIALALVTLLFASDSAAFDDFASTVGYSAQYVIQHGDDGMNPIRGGVYAVPVILAFLFRNKLKRYNNPMFNICTNMSIITLGVALVAMVTSGILTGRMLIYTSLYNMILYPFHFQKDPYSGRRYNYLYYLTIIAYLAYYFIEAG